MEPDLVTDPSGKKEEDVVPLEAENIRGVDKRGAMVFFGSGSNTFYITEDEVWNNKALVGEGVVSNAHPLSYVNQDDDVGSLRGNEGDGVPNLGTEVVCEDQTAGEEHESMEETTVEAKGDVGETEVEKDKDEAVEKEAVWRDVMRRRRMMATNCRLLKILVGAKD
ncbi:unnamed protein product [Brassica oleracea var. botrytis]